MKKITKKPILFLFLLQLLILAIVFFQAFSEATASHKLHYLPTSWTSFSKDNTKKILKEKIYELQTKLRGLTITNNIIKKNLEENKIPFFEISIPRGDLKQLNSSLPSSGKTYVEASLIHDKNDSEKIEIKYRGDHHFHWGFEKKSLKIKKEDDRVINLINPKLPNFIGNQIGFEYAKKLGLYAPETNFVGIFINKEFEGIYFQTEEFDQDYITQNSFDHVYKGDNVAESQKSGQKMFNDPRKWEVSAGYSQNSIQDLLEAINTGNLTNLFSVIDFNYLTNFYSYVSFINNIHYDYAHNWILGFKNNKYFPIVWDPLAWQMKYQEEKLGRCIEDVNSPISTLLRKSAYFNIAFTKNLWGLVNDKTSEHWLYDQMGKQKDLLIPILEYDYHKGGVNNSQGMRSPQSTQEIMKEINLLKTKIGKRVNYIKESLSTTLAQYYTEGSYTYLQYDGLPQAIIDQLYDGQTGKVSDLEIFNLGNYQKLPAEIKGIISGREKRETGWHYYAQTCPTTYRFKTKEGVNPKLTNTLTGKEIKIERVNSFEIKDCVIDFTLPKNNTPIASSNNHLPINPLSITFSAINPEKYFSLREKTEEKITLNISGINYNNVEFKKSKFKEKINLDFGKSGYFGKEKLDLLPLVNTKYSQISKITEIAGLLNLPQNKYETVDISANGSYVGQYLLIENPKNKSFFETNKLTYDTDIYRLTEEESDKSKNWKKISSDPRVKEENKETLTDFLDSVNNKGDFPKKIDLDNLANFYTYLFLSGNEFPKYILYFDNTQGKFKFIPEEHVLYKTSEDFKINDPLLSKILSDLTIKTSIHSKLKNLDLTLFLKDKNDYLQYNLQILNSYRQKLIFDENPVDSNKTDKDNLVNLQEMFRLDFERNPGSVTIKAQEYEIKKDTIIPAGFKIVIEAGTIIKINPGVSLLSYSPIIAQGNEKTPINIIPAKNKPWGVFALVGKQSSGSLLDFVNISGGSETFINHLYLSGQFSAYHSDIIIRNSTFKNSFSDDGLNLKYSKSQIKNCLFENNSGDAIDLDFVSGTVEDNVFNHNGDDSIDISGSDVIISNNKINNSGDKCISVGEKSNPQINNNLLEGCYIGIEIKDESEINAKNNIIKNNEIGINAYQKKDFFGGGYGNLYQTVFLENKKDYDYKNTFTGVKLSSDDSKITIH